MKLRSLLLLAAALTGLSEWPIATAAPAPATGTRVEQTAAAVDTRWQELIPPGWDGLKAFRLQTLGSITDGSPRAAELMEQMRDAMDNAPTNVSLEGANVRLAGYVVPLDPGEGSMKEFLLVPYFGACIHVPPPPANQIVHVVVDKPLTGYRAMAAVRVSGVLTSVRFGSGMGEAGYQLRATSVDNYVAR